MTSGPVTVSGTVDTNAENSVLPTPWLLYADLVITRPRGQVNVHVTPGTIGLTPSSPRLNESIGRASRQRSSV